MGQQLRGGRAVNQVAAFPFAILLVLVIGLAVLCDQELALTSMSTMTVVNRHMLFRPRSGIRGG
jgi:ABC-type methionine transport system permease subunit